MERSPEKKLIKIDNRPPIPPPHLPKELFGEDQRPDQGDAGYRAREYTHLFMLNMQVNNQSNLNTKEKKLLTS